MGRGIKENLNIQTVALRSHNGLAGMGSYDRPNRELTFDDPRVFAIFEGNREEFNAKWKEALVYIMDSFKDSDHQKALDVFEKLHVDMGLGWIVPLAQEMEEIANGEDV